MVNASGYYTNVAESAGQPATFNVQSLPRPQTLPQVTQSAVRPQTPAAPVQPAQPKYNVMPDDWSQYLGTGHMDSDMRDDSDGFTNQAGWERMQTWLRQFDPNARYESGFNPTTGGGGTRMIFDQSKLPVNPFGVHGTDYLSRGNPGSGERLANPNAVIDDPVYGHVTHNTNLRDKGPSMVDIIGPIMMAAITGGAGYLAGGMPLGATLGQAGVNAARGVGNGNYIGAAGSFLPSVGRYLIGGGG